MDKKSKFLFGLFIFFVLSLGPGVIVSSAARSEESPRTEPETAAASDGESELREVQHQEHLTEDMLKEKKEVVEKMRKEAEKTRAAKQSLQTEAALKEEAVRVAQEELEVLKQEAQVTQTPEVRRQAGELTRQIEKLEEEAVLSRRKLEVAQAKAGIAERQLAASETMVRELKEELRGLRIEEAGKRSWSDKLLNAGGILATGILVMLLLAALKRIEDFVTDKNVLRESEAALRVKTLIKLFHWLGVILIILVMIYFMLRNFGIDITPLLAGAGIVGLAVGFGGQYMIHDVINGIFIISEGQYRIHDVVKINEYSGLVEEINLRITVLRDLEGRVITIPNGKIDTVVNFTKDYAHALIDLGVAYKEDADHVMAAVKETGRGLREDLYYGRLILDDLEMLGVDEFSESRVVIKFRIKTLPIKQWDVSREFRRRIKKRFDEEGIEIACPHRVLYWGNGKENEWLRVLAQKTAGTHV